MTKNINAVVLAGRGRGEMGGKHHFVLANGTTLMENTCKTIHATGMVDKMAVLLTEGDSIKVPKDVEVIWGSLGNNLFQNLRHGIYHYSSSDWLLVCSGDMPFLTTAAVTDFINKCGRAPASLYYPIIEKRYLEKQYPGTQKTYVNTMEGDFSGGNLILTKPAVFEAALDKVDRVLNNRKNPLAIAGILGWRILIKLLMKKLSVSDVEARCDKLLGVKVRAIESTFPEVGFDVDKKEEWEAIKNKKIMEFSEIS